MQEVKHIMITKTSNRKEEKKKKKKKSLDKVLKMNDSNQKPKYQILKVWIRL